MEIYNCLDKDLNVWGHHFLEASAGTGKTFTIEHVVVRLLLDPKAIDIDQILIVTFTRAATRELKLRLQKRLRECLKALQDRVPKYPYLDLPATEKTFAEHRLQLALSCFDKAQIFTIHSFCHRMLHQFCFEASYAIDSTGMDEQDYQGFLHGQVKDFIRTGLKPELFSPFQIQLALQACGGTSDQLAQRLGQLVDQTAAAAVSITDIQLSINHALQTGPICQNLHTQLEEIAQHFKGTCNRSGQLLPSIAAQIALLTKVMQKKAMTVEEIDHFLEADPCLLLQLQSSQRKKNTTQQKLPALHQWIEKNLSPVFQKARDPKQVLLHMAALCKERLDQAKSASDIMSPDDVLNHLNHALDKPCFKQAVREQYQAAIIDEFQDTDPTQWSIFQKLFLDPRFPIPAFYLVGDPKQSIYAFRKADLYTYLGAAETIGKSNRKVLCTNYRSSQELIAGLNQLFGHNKTKHWLELPSSHLALEYTALLAQQKTEPFNDGKKAVHLLKIEQYSGRAVPSKELEEEVLFPYIATQIKALSLDFSAFAVLIKDRYQAQRLAQFFRNHALPCICKNEVSVCTSKAYLLLDALFQAVLRPNNLADVKRFLSAPLITWVYSRLLVKNFDADLQNVSAKLHKLNEVWQQHGFASALNIFLDSDFGSGISVRKQLSTHRQNYLDFSQLCELLLEEEGKKPHSIRDLYRVFKNLKHKNPDYHPELKKRNLHTKDAVTLMTTYMSKGLEFDIVFALGMASRHGEEDNIELEAEKFRLFYVAMTRAKRRVYLPVIYTPNKTCKPQEASPAEKFFEKWTDLHDLESDSVSVETLSGKISCPSFPQKKIQSLQPPKPCNFEIKKHLVSSYSSLVKPAISHVQRLKAETDEINLHTLPAGAHVGTLLHHLLEKATQLGLYQKDTITSYVKQKVGELKPWLDNIVDLIYQVMHLPLDGFCLKDVPKDSMMQEMEFLLPLKEDLMVKGFADLIVHYRNKSYIIDWKSNWLGVCAEDYSPENLKRAMEQHDYFLQARLYGAALIRWLKNYDKRSPCEFYGGAYYVFLRGIENETTRGIYHYRNI